MRMPALETERLTVRELRPADVDAASALLGGDRSAWLDWTIRSYAQLAELHQPPYGDRAVVLRETGEWVGLAGLVPSLGPFELLPSWPGRSDRHRPEVGLFYHVAEAHRRRGYAAEAAAALAGHAFAELSLGRVVATTEHTNLASIAVMRRLGMRVERNPLPEPPWFQVIGVLEAGVG